MIKDDSALILYDNFSDEGTLSGGDWLSDLPLSNLQKDRLEHIARSSDTETDSTQFKISLKESVDIAAIYLGWTNLSVDASLRIRFWLTSSFSGTPHYDTDWLTDIIPDDPDPDRGPSIYHILENATAAQFISVEIDDQNNQNGKIDIARLVIGRYLKPSFNYTYDGNAFQFNSNALIAATLSGDEVIWDRPEPRRFTAAFQYLPEDEVFGDVYHFVRTVKRGGEMIVIPKPNAGALELQRRSFLCHAINREPLVQTIVERGNFSFEVREKMGLEPTETSNIYRERFSAGSFTLAGTPAELAKIFAVTAEAGIFALTVQDADLTIRRLTADAGTFSLTGEDANFIRALVVSLSDGAFTVSGQDVDLSVGTTVSLAAGSFTLTGEDAAITRNLQFGPAAATFSLTGQSALIRDWDYRGLAGDQAGNRRALAGDQAGSLRRTT